MTIPSLRGNSVSSVAPLASQAITWDGTQWSPATVNSSLVFRPGGVASQGVFPAWADLMAALATTSGPATIVIDTSLGAATIPAGNWDMGYRTKIVPYKNDANAPVALTLADNAVLANLASIDGVIAISAQGTSQPNLSFGQSATLSISGGAMISNDGSLPLISVGAGVQIVVSLGQGGSYASPGGYALADAATATSSITCSAFIFAQFSVPNAFTGVAGSSLIFLYDASIQNLPPCATFLGSKFFLAVDVASQVAYSDAAPLLGSSNVQGAIDALKPALSNLAVLVLQPGGTASTNVFTTWADLMAAFALTKGLVTIEIDRSLGVATVDAPGVFDFQNRATFSAPGINSPAPTGFHELIIPDGAVLANVQGMVGNVALVCQSTTISNLRFASGSFFVAYNDAAILNQGAAAVPAITMASGDTLALQFYEGAAYQNDNGPRNAVLVDLPFDSNSVTIIAQTYGGPTGNYVVSGGGGTNLAQYALVYDSSFAFVPTNPTFTGATTNTPVSHGSTTIYADTAPTLGSSTVQGAIDALKGYLGGKIHWLVVGGAYPTFQDAINACAPGDTIMVGPVATVGTTWGDGIFPDLIPINVVGLSASNSLSCAVGLINFPPTTGFSIEDNGLWLQNLVITGDFTLSPDSAGVVFKGTSSASLRLQGCLILNTGTGGTGLYIDNSGGSSNCYVVDCDFHAPNNVGGQQILQNQGFTKFASCEITEGIGALVCNGGAVEFWQVRLEYADPDPAHSVIIVNGGLVYCQDTLVRNSQPNGNGIELGASGALAFNNSVLDIAQGAAPGGYCVWGTGTYVYGQVTYVDTTPAGIPRSTNVQNTLTLLASAQAFTIVP